jgi:2-dehydro-3-deoxyphosphooctonate aldolase (KDO 8-P synthase)
MKTVVVNKIKIGNKNPLVIIAGTCVIESEDITLKTAEKIKQITTKLNLPFIFKSSYDKGNRSAVEYYRGPGIDKGLEILSKVKKEFDVAVISDVHCRNEIDKAKDVLDIIQIPAYLCQQTDLVVSVAKTGKVINIKKGQFIAPWDMKKIVTKALTTGNDNILLTERGTVFGYNNLVSDIRAIPIMQEIGYPVFVDVTHIVRLPGPASKDSSGGQPQFISVLSQAAAGAGCDGLFLEVHPEPKDALCDAASMLKLDKLEELLTIVKSISEIVRK